jgi:uncharacterized protein YabE (DUF348 family)
MSGTTKQKEAVFSAVSSVLTEAGISVNEGDNFAASLNRELRAQVTNILVEGFNNGTIALDKSFESEADLRTYCSGLTSNWLRKDPRMNGGVKYVAKNPGSRVGSADPTIKSMRTLLATRTDLSVADRADIQAAIDSRVAEVRSSKKNAKVLTAEQIELLKNAGLDQYLS